MEEFLTSFFKCFVPIFVAMDPIGIIPIFIGLTLEMDIKAKRKLTRNSMFTASMVSTGFLFLGKFLFDFMGVRTSDFQVAGGLLLLLLAISELSFGGAEKRRTPDTDLGIVPIGIPLIMGPAALTAIVMLEAQYGLWITLLSLAINITIMWLVLVNASRIVRIIGNNGAKGAAKITALLLAAYAITMIRSGIEDWYHTLINQ